MTTWNVRVRVSGYINVSVKTEGMDEPPSEHQIVMAADDAVEGGDIEVEDWDDPVPLRPRRTKKEQPNDDARS